MTSGLCICLFWKLGLLPYSSQILRAWHRDWHTLAHLDSPVPESVLSATTYTERSFKITEVRQTISGDRLKIRYEYSMYILCTKTQFHVMQRMASPGCPSARPPLLPRGPARAAGQCVAACHSSWHPVTPPPPALQTRAGVRQARPWDAKFQVEHVQVGT